MLLVFSCVWWRISFLGGRYRFTVVLLNKNKNTFGVAKSNWEGRNKYLCQLRQWSTRGGRDVLLQAEAFWTCIYISHCSLECHWFDLLDVALLVTHEYQSHTLISEWSTAFSISSVNWTSFTAWNIVLSSKLHNNILSPFSCFVLRRHKPWLRKFSWEEMPSKHTESFVSHDAVLFVHKGHLGMVHGWWHAIVFAGRMFIIQSSTSKSLILESNT